MRSIYFLTALAVFSSVACGFYLGRLQTANELLHTLVGTTKCDYGQDVESSSFGWRWALVRYEKQ